jgi:D-cysteine desulfhydrase family pyridoxal phosphate-dependent enzyme
MRIEDLPRFRVGKLPTPLEKMINLSKVTNIPHLYMKRDDLTDIGYGGNKIRKLEFLLADARDKGADIVMSTGGVQSNFTRQAAAFAAKVGMRSICILLGEEPEEYRGNLLLEKLMGAEIYFASAENLDEGARVAAELMESLTEQFEAEGHTCYPMPISGSTPMGNVGFTVGFLEFYSQMKDLGIDADHIILATGSGGTLAGLLVGKMMTGSEATLMGIRVGYMFDPFRDNVAQMANELSSFLELDFRFSAEDIITFDDYIGEGYDIPTSEANEAIKLVASTEAIFLDPVYTGKGMAGLLGLVEQGEIPRDDIIVFWHTGGHPALFVGEELLGKEFMESLKQSSY